MPDKVSVARSLYGKMMKPFRKTALSVIAAANNWAVDANIDSAINDLDSALTTLRSTASTMGSNASVLSMRLDFTKNLIKHSNIRFR